MDNETGKVRFKVFLGAFMLICGLIILFMSIMITGVSINTVTGGILTIFSFMYMMNPILTYSTKGFEKKNLFGMTLKTYTFSSDEVVVRNDTVFVNGKKMRIGKNMLIKSEYEKFLNHLVQNSGEDHVSRGKTNEELLDADI